MRIEELMTRFPVTCGPDETLNQAAQKMQGADFEFLPVMADPGSQRLVGVISAGDIEMAAQLRVCNPGDSLFEAEAIMRRAGIRHLPVVDESDRLLGVLSLADVAYEADRECEALSSRITAAQFGLVVSGVREPYGARRPANAAGPVHHALESSAERRAAAG